MTYKNVTLGLLFAVAVLLGVSFPTQSSAPVSVGAGFDTVLRTFSAGIKIGSAGNTVTSFQYGTCNLVGPTSITLASVADFVCTAAGVKSGDNVNVMAPATQVNSISVHGATASTTNGYITVRLRNASTTGSTTLLSNSTSSFLWRSWR